MRFITRNVASQEASLVTLRDLIRKNAEHPYVRATALKIVRDCAGRDDECELNAIFEAVKNGDPAVLALAEGFPYRADPNSLDFFTGAARALKMCESGACGGDCLPYDTLVLRHDYHLVPIADIEIGDVIMGDGGWTTVTNRWEKGEKDLLAITLANGSTLRVTPDHRLFRVPKTRQGYAGPRDAAEEVRAGDLRPDDDLLTVEQIPFGVEQLDTERAWLLGAFIADGWVDGKLDEAPSRVCISGRDGYPKEEQKRRVQTWCEQRGLSFRWHERYIAINDAATAQWLAAAGKRAPSKHVPSGLNFDEATIRALISGLIADAHVRADGVTTHGTTSARLAVQLRVLYRMLGQSTHVRRVDDHGGLGANPIYRVTPRVPDRGRGAKPHARIRTISSIEAAPVMDIETDTHRFYLPETDLVVHNCDDHTILVGSLAGSLGFIPGARGYGTSRNGPLTHVYAVALTPKRKQKHMTVIGMDTTVPESYLGWQPPPGRYLTAWCSKGA